MKFTCPLIVVSDIETSRDFYENVMKQTVEYDFGENVQFKEGFVIHLKPHFAKMVEVKEEDIVSRSNNVELYFEDEEIEAFVEALEANPKIEFLHGLIEHPWGQRAIRFYDPDAHIIEVAESMHAVVNRLISSGLTVDETAEITQHPVEFVISCIENNEQN